MWQLLIPRDPRNPSALNCPSTPFLSLPREMPTALIYFQIIVDVIKGNFIYSYSYRTAVENDKFIFFSIVFVKLLLCVHIVCRRECTWARRWAQVQNSFVEPVVSFHHLWGALVWFCCWDKLHDQWRGQRIYFMYTSRLYSIRGKYGRKFN